MATGEVLMVRGPAIVHVIGKCHVLGMDVSHHTIHVRAAKALPFEPDEDCKLDVQGESWAADAKNAGTRIWREIAERILSLGKTGATITILIVGATDTGKSTFATYLANLALERGMTPCIIDGDIGQGDLAPPAALGAAVIREPVVDLRDAPACLFEFVGSITPSNSERLVVQKLKSLIGRTSADLKVVNTDGYLDPFYKRMLASAVSPNVLVYMSGLDDDHDGLAKELSGQWSLIVAPSSWQAAKTHSDRIGRRIEQYSRYIGTGLVSKSIHTVRFQYRNRFIRWYAVLSLGPEGMFVALGSRRRITGFGMVESMDRQHVSIRTDVNDFSTIHTSEIRLRKNHEERIIGSFRVLGRWFQER